MPAFVDLKGLVFSRWAVLEKIDVAGRIKWKCMCECGEVRSVLSTSLISGKSKSCGCLNSEMCSERITLRQTTHGLSGTKTYHIWASMRNRCADEKNVAWKNYGGRGIKVCERWNNSFELFLEDMGHPKKGMSIDRINNDLGYSKENCRWATVAEQSSNKRCCWKISSNGETKGFAEWASYYGIDRKQLYSRVIISKWPFEKAVSAALKEKTETRTPA